MEKYCGIYMIQCLVNGKIYVGSSIDIYRRWSEHKTGRAVNKHFKNAFNAHGSDAFQLYILEECLENRLVSRERYYWHLLQPEYNKVEPGACWNRGRKATDAQRERNRVAQQGKKLTSETRKRMSTRMTKAWQDTEFSEKLSAHTRTPEWRCKARDTLEKSRQQGILTQVKGETHPRAKLREIDVLAIRVATEHPTALAVRYGVTVPTVYNILARRIWRHI